MKEIFKPFKLNKQYRISNKGRIYSKYRNLYIKPYQTNPFSKLLYVALKVNKTPRCFAVHKLVANHFKRMKPTDETAYHIDYDQQHNIDLNLRGSSRSFAISRTRQFNKSKKKLPTGVYKWNRPNCDKKYRVMFSTGKGWLKTFGYFKTKKEAIELYKIEYKKQYGYNPFIKSEIK